MTTRAKNRRNGMLNGIRKTSSMVQEQFCFVMIETYAHLYENCFSEIYFIVKALSSWKISGPNYI